jgi:hypothetical protein
LKIPYSSEALARTLEPFRVSNSWYSMNENENQIILRKCHEHAVR